MFSNDEIIDICKQYKIVANKIGEVIDSSRNEEDQRYNYKINNDYMLKINTVSFIDEEFLQNVDCLINHYRGINVYCPQLIKRNEGVFTYKIVHDNREYVCYMEEYSKYETAEMAQRDEHTVKKDMMWHIGKLASMYTGVDLVKTRSMWSIIDLAPLDVEIDEKQENLNTLADCLENYGYSELAKRLVEENKKLRDHIINYFTDLPRCVYQGDLNLSNVLVDEKGGFQGIIDFNMFGTEVNINCFLNETMYYINKNDFKELTAEEIFKKMMGVQNQLLEEIFCYYELNSAEKLCFDAYKKIIYLSFYPNVMLFLSLIKAGEKKVINLINLIVEM